MNSILMLLRHARAGWATPGMRDFERPLTEAGLAECRVLGHRMRAAGWSPEQVLCSGAVRARQTCERVLAQMPAQPARIDHLDALYDGDATAYLDIVKRFADGGPLLVVGHNPMMEDLSAALTTEGGQDVAEALRGGYPTAGLAVIGFEEPLSSIAPGRGRLLAFLDGSD